MAKKRVRSLESVRNRAGYTFVAHWAIGLLMFFIVPLVSSIWYSVNDVSINAGEVKTDYVGFSYFKDLFTVDPDYVDNLGESIGMMFYSLPIIIALSLILAVLLNQKFKGRTIFRAIFFLPIIIANSVVMDQLNSDVVTMPLFSSGEGSESLINYAEIISGLGIPSEISPILTFLLSNTINLIWKCGVQTILFLAGLQSISSSMYEVSKIEGANKWEEFWLITVPSLRHIISLVIIYTMIELFVSLDNKLVSVAYENMVEQKYGLSSAMLWIYFVIVLALIGTVYILYQRYCVKKWE
ncbi:MAG: sugar ABC transporter permease [Ruminococcaceae bacterium]|nr:sugar ABC transporter permease [Oscillospiraceae bacterium]